jgi:hypothetical protein
MLPRRSNHAARHRVARRPGCLNNHLAHLHLPAQIVPAFLQRCDDVGRPTRGDVLASELVNSKSPATPAGQAARCASR